MLRAGDGFEKCPWLGDLVTIRCVGYLSDLSSVDDCDEITFVLGDNETLQGKDFRRAAHSNAPLRLGR